jgi:hypothetical protein
MGYKVGRLALHSFCLSQYLQSFLRATVVDQGTPIHDYPARQQNSRNALPAFVITDKMVARAANPNWNDRVVRRGLPA